MPLKEHLRELRNRLAISLVAIAAGGVWGWLLFDRIFEFLGEPYRQVAIERGIDPSRFGINFTNVVSPFNVHIKVAVAVGLVLGSPIWLYQIWAFVVPGLKKTEKKYALAFVGAALPLFLLGGFLATRVIPVAVGFLVDLAPKSDTVSALNTADNVIDFGVKMILGFGVMFVLPVLLVGLNFLGVLPARTLIKGWRVVVLLVFVFSAMASPAPDATSMLLLAVPVLLLFAIALVICLVNDRRKAARSTEPDYSKLSDDEASPIEPDTFDPDRDNR